MRSSLGVGVISVFSSQLITHGRGAGVGRGLGGKTSLGMGVAVTGELHGLSSSEKERGRVRSWGTVLSMATS